MGFDLKYFDRSNNVEIVPPELVAQRKLQRNMEQAKTVAAMLTFLKTLKPGQEIRLEELYGAFHLQGFNEISMAIRQIKDMFACNRLDRRGPRYTPDNEYKWLAFDTVEVIVNEESDSMEDTR